MPPCGSMRLLAKFSSNHSGLWAIGMEDGLTISTANRSRSCSTMLVERTGWRLLSCSWRKKAATGGTTTCNIPSRWSFLSGGVNAWLADDGTNCHQNLSVHEYMSRLQASSQACIINRYFFLKVCRHLPILKCLLLRRCAAFLERICLQFIFECRWLILTVLLCLIHHVVRPTPPLSLYP